MSANSGYDLSQPYEGKSVPTYASDDTSDRADELTRLRGEVEQLQVQLAGCGAAALGATKDPATKGEYGWSPAYQDVLNLRLEVESLRRSNEGFEAHLEVLQREVESLRKQIVGQPDWRKRSDEIHREFIRRAPNPWEPYSTEDIRFLGLAIAGEVGELANFIKKKFWHGDDIAPQEFIKELADIRIYLELLSRCFYCDLDEACAGKLDEVQARLDRAMEKAE